MMNHGGQFDSESTDPIERFQAWFAEASKTAEILPESCALATATADGRPSARMVLLKEVTREGFVFFTNYESRKSQEMTTNPRASLLFHWASLQRQVRIEGKVARVSREESEQYFATRPRISQVGAWASPQSRQIADRQALEARALEIEKKYENQEIPCPPHWGGYRLVPEQIEFWVGRVGRLHDRFLFTRSGAGGPSEAWTLQRLAP